MIGYASRYTCLAISIVLLTGLNVSGGIAATNKDANTSSRKSYTESPFPGGKTIRVGVSHNPPFASHGNGASPQGFVIDIIRAVAKKKRWNLVYVEKKWSDLLTSLESGKIDLLGGIARTPARALKYDLSAESIANNWAVVYRSPNTEINGIIDLNGKRIALIPKGVHTTALIKLSQSFDFRFTPIPAKDYAQTLEFLDKGDADVGVVARSFHVLHASKYKALLTNVRFNPIEIAFAAPKGGGIKVLVDIDHFLSTQKNNPTSHYHELLTRWFKGGVKEITPAWINQAAFAFLAVFLLSFYIIFLLRKKLKAKVISALNSEQKFRSIFENSAEGIFRATLEGSFVNANPAMAKILLYDSSEDLINNVTNTREQLFYDPSVRDDCIDLLISNDWFTGKEMQWRRKGGSLVWVSASVHKVKDENGVAYFEGVVHDISERKQAEQDLHENTAMLKAIFDNTPVCMNLKDISGRYILINKPYADWFGRTPEEIIGKKAYEFLADSNRAKTLDDVEKAVLETGESNRRELKIFRHDGTIHDRNVIKFPVKSADGLINAIGTIAIDITERKHLESQLRQAQKMEAVGQLTGGLAHDFNNLLGIMIGNTEMLEDRIVGDTTAERQIEALKEAVDNASSLTNRLLAFSRQHPLAPEPLKISDLINGISDLLQSTLGATIDLRIECTRDLWAGIVDRHQFENALVNLAINARDAMPTGGKLSIMAANVTLDEAYTKRNKGITAGDYIKISVSDTGTGMPPDVLEKVFEPFFTTKEFGKGSGLGLSMVYGFTMQSKGHITIDSQVNNGTIVTLFIPCSKDFEFRNDTENHVLVEASGSERILVVEDDIGVLNICVEILRSQGYDITEAENGEDAIIHLKGGKVFDLLFTDVVLPGGMNGLEIADKAIQIQPAIKTLYTTGYAENIVFHEDQLDSGVSLIHKPYRRAELLEKVRAILNQKTRNN